MFSPARLIVYCPCYLYSYTNTIKDTHTQINIYFNPIKTKQSTIEEEKLHFFLLPFKTKI